MKTVAFAIAVLTLVGCGPEKRQPAVTSAPPAAPEAAASPPRAKPEIGAWGFDLAGMDRSVAPGASFYRHANGHWLTSTPIPADKPSYGMFAQLSDRSDDRTRQIIEAAVGPPGSDGQRIGDYYKTFLDEAAIEAKGAAPIQRRLDDIARIKDVNGIVVQFAISSRQLSTSPLRASINQDDREPDHYIANLAQGGLGLPDRDMYDAKAQQFAPLREGYRKYIAAMFSLIGAKDADRRAAAVYGLEEKLAQTHWTRVQNRDPQKTYNKMTIAELGKLAPGVDWKPWLEAVGLQGQAQLVVNQPPAIAATSLLVKRQPLAVWKDYLTLHTITDAAPYLSKPFVDTHFAMFGKLLRGTPELRPRWKRAVNDVAQVMGEAVGKFYVARYFTPETKAHADELVKNLLAAMGQRLDALTWMSPETKAKAKAKLATYNPKIGYPKRWRDYAALTIVAGDAVGNAERAAEFEYNRRLARLGQPVDRDEWEIPPMTVDAYYNPVLNEIVFPAAILQPPFFDANADDAVNYGGIGAVIGHEVSHGFDDQGAQYDAKGALANWWTSDDADKFKTATDKLVAQYNAYCPIHEADGKPAQCVNGALTLGENIADLAGVTIAYHAYQLALGGKPAPVIDGVTGDQRFFLGWAQVWRGKYRAEELANQLVTNPHSPVSYRASTVRNLDAWYDAFQPKPDEALYLAADQRVKIW